MSKVLFKSGSSDAFTKLVQKDANTLYFLTDTQQIYKGNTLYTSQYEVVSSLPETGVQGKLYIDSVNLTMHYWADKEFKQLSDTYAGTFDEVNNAKAPTVKAVKDYVTAKIQELDATASQTAGADGLSLNITQVDGKVTAISGSIAANTYDNFGAAAAVKTALEGSASDAATAATIAGAKKYADDKIAGLNNVAKTGAAADVAIADAGNLITATNVEAALQEVATKINTTTEAGKVTLDDAATPGEGILKVYTIKQGTETVGTINIPKELVVTSGEVIVATEGEFDNAVAGDKYIKLTIANQADPIYIAVKDLVDVYTTEANAAEVKLNIADNNEISATVVKVAATKINRVINGELVEKTVEESLAIVEEAIAEINGDDSGLALKADKVANATAGNLASLTSDGNPSDSGFKIVASATDTNEVPTVTIVEGKISDSASTLMKKLSNVTGGKILVSTTGVEDTIEEGYNVQKIESGDTNTIYTVSATDAAIEAAKTSLINNEIAAANSAATTAETNAKSYTDDQINNLNADCDAEALEGAGGTIVASGIVQENGIITLVKPIEVESVGAAAAVESRLIGTDEDTKDSNTIKGAMNYAEDLLEQAISGDISTKMNRMDTGDANKVVLSMADGNVYRSTLSVGSDDTTTFGTNNTLATEAATKAYVDASIVWEEIK